MFTSRPSLYLSPKYGAKQATILISGMWHKSTSTAVIVIRYAIVQGHSAMIKKDRLNLFQFSAECSVGTRMV